MTAGEVWRGFRRWRHRRPFWGALFLLLAGAELFYTANASLAGLSVHLGPTGFLSYLLPLILVVCALLCLFSPAQRLFYGIIGLLAALYSFIGLNLGGFFVGMLLGIVGGALVIAWGPPRVRPADPGFVPIADQIAMEQEAAETGEIKTAASEDETEQVEVAGHDDRPAEDVRPATAQEPGFVPGFHEGDDQEGPKSGPARSRFSRNPKALTVAFIVMGLTAAMLAVGSRVPASAAADCPSGLPSRSVSASPSRTTAAADKAAAGTAGSATSAAKKAAKKTTAGKTTAGKTSGTTSKATPTASPTKDKDGNPIVDGVKGIVGGVGNLLGIGDDPSSSASPSESPTPSPTATTAPATTGPTTPATGGGSTTDPAKGTSDPATSAPATPTSATPSPSGSDIPCLGPRVFGLNADGDGVPLITGKPGVLETDSLQMFDSTYDGVVNLPTGSDGSARVLKFSMSKAVNKPFSLTIAETGGKHTVIKSNELTTDGNVKFYTERFEGKLFGLIPVVFTPDSPPPLTLPYLWFTDVTIQLNYVQCDTLTGFPLQIDEK